MPAEKCVWLNNVKGLFPKFGKPREQNKPETVSSGQLGSFHLSIEYDQLLAKQGILDNQIRTGTSSGLKGRRKLRTEWWV